MLLFGLLIIPSIAFASWWNPGTWFNSDKPSEDVSSGTNISNQELLNKISELEKKVDAQGTSSDTTISLPTQHPLNTSSDLQIKIDLLTSQNTALQSKLTTAQSNYAICQSNLTKAHSVSSNSVSTNISVGNISDEQKSEITGYLKERLNILNELIAFYSPLNNKNVQSYSGVLSQTIPKISLVSNEINALVIPDVTFSNLFTNDQGLLLHLQSDFYTYGLALEYKQTDPMTSLNNIGNDNIQLVTSLQNIKAELKKDSDSDYITQVGSYFQSPQ